MNVSIFWENPGLTLLGVLAAIFVVLLLPIIGAMRRSREERFDASLRSREPNIFNAHYDDRQYDSRGYDDRPDYGSYFSRYADDQSSDGFASHTSSRDGRGDPPAGVFGSGPRRRKSVRVTAPARSMIWFVTGLCVGAGGLALWWKLPPVNPLPTVMALFDRSAPSPAVAEAPAARVDSKGQERVGGALPQVMAAPAAADGGGDVSEMVDTFVTNLKAQLPMAVGPGITMAAVNANSNTVALGFTIAQSVTAEDAPKLQKELESRFRSNVCSTSPDPSNIHGLNERGVAFIINYVDLLGKNVAELTVKPNFCSNPA